MRDEWGREGMCGMGEKKKECVGWVRKSMNVRDE